MRAKSLQSCPTLCDPMDFSPPGSSVHGIFLAREYWSGLPFPSPEDLSNPRIEPSSPVSPALPISYPLSQLGSPYIHIDVVYLYAHMHMFVRVYMFI